MTLVAPPLNKVRKAIFDRIKTSSHTSGFNLLTEGGEAPWPYIAVTAAYKGEGGTDPELGVRAVVQVEAYAENAHGGSHQVETMGDAVYAAIGNTDIVIPPYRPLTVTVEHDGYNLYQMDPAHGEAYAQRIIRFKFLITT